DKYLSGTGLYRINKDVNAFREIIFKGFINNSESLILSLEKNSIVLMIGRYVYEENTEYIVLIQTVPISFSNDTYVLTSTDLPYSSPMLQFSAPVVQNSYHPNNEGGRESFMLTRRLYNGVTNNKHVLSNVIILYVNENNHYNALKNNLQKTVLSVIGRLKIESFNILHIIASDIEWTYSNNESQSSGTLGKEKSRFYEELDNQLNSIEEKYATLSSQPSQKKPKLTLYSTTAKKSNNIPTSVNFTNIISQVRLNKHPSEPNNINSTPENTEHINSSKIYNSTISLSHTEKEADIAPINNNEPITTPFIDSSLSSDKNTKQAKKNLRPLLPLKK
ncbi:21266_t:CDS:2, partial [Gigaspora margarita]